MNTFWRSFGLLFLMMTSIQALGFRRRNRQETSKDVAPWYRMGRLVHLLERNLYKTVPIVNMSEPVTIHHSLSMVALHDYNPVSNTITLRARNYFTWNDPRISWAPVHHGGITHVQLQSSSIWIPEAYFYPVLNEQKTHFHDTLIHDVTASMDGDVIWSYEESYQIQCDSDETCTFRLWTPYQGSNEIMFEASRDEIGLSDYSAYQYQVTESHARVEMITHEDHPEPREHSVITYTFTFNNSKI